MPCLYLSEISDPELRILAKYAIGDRVRVVKINGIWENYPEDTQEAFRQALGQVLPIQDIILWETDDPANPYLVTYMVELGSDCEGDTLYLEEDEIELVNNC